MQHVILQDFVDELTDRSWNGPWTSDTRMFQWPQMAMISMYSSAQ